MRYKMNVLFYHKLKKINSRGTAPIYVRITIDGIEKEFSSGRNLRPDQWENKMVRNHPDAALINIALKAIGTKLAAIHLDLELKDIPVSASLVRQLYKAPGKKRHPITSLYMDWYKEKTAGVSVETARQYKVKKDLLWKYLEASGNLAATTDQLSTMFATGFGTWLDTYIKKDGDPLSTNYKSTQRKYLKFFFNWCEEKGFTPANPCAGQKLKWVKNPPITLRDHEISRVLIMPLASSPLIKARDMLLFQCLTGFAYVDMKNFQKTWIKDGVIRYKRQKGKAEGIVPLYPATLQLLEKYGYRMGLMTRERYNLYVKELMHLAGIDKKITSHKLRKTCGRWLRSKGVSLDVVSKVLGHKSTSMTEQIYAQIDEERVIKETQELRPFIASEKHIKEHAKKNQGNGQGPVELFFHGLYHLYRHTERLDNRVGLGSPHNENTVPVGENLHREPFIVQYNRIA